MPRLPDARLPSYCRHKPSGQAVVYIDGRMIYLGKWKSPQAKAEYDRVIGEWLAAGRRLPSDPNSLTIAEVVNAFRKHALTYYRRPDGTMSSEPNNFDQAFVPLLKLYGKTPAAEFGPLRLKSVRDEMIRMDRARTNINKQLSRIRSLFKWGVENELIPAPIYQGLIAVPGLRPGRSDARESEPVKPVAVEHVEAIYPYVSAQVKAMIELQLITGMRPGEVIAMTTGSIDRSGKLWVYRPQQHKTLHHGHSREIFLGPKAQEVVKAFLKLDPAAFIFDPRDAEADRREAMHAKRKTPIKYGNRPGSNRKTKPKRIIGNQYDVDTYRRSISRACDKADNWQKGGRIVGNDDRIIPHWHPHQLRHTAATELRKTHGIEAAQVILGHRTLNVTELYAEKNVESAMKIMAQIG